MLQWQNTDFCPNAVHRSLQQRASMREGPADPSVSTADFQMASAVMLSKRTGWKSLSTTSVLKRTSVCGGSGCGLWCLCWDRGVLRTSHSPLGTLGWEGQWDCDVSAGTGDKGDIAELHKEGRGQCEVQTSKEHKWPLYFTSQSPKETAGCPCMFTTPTVTGSPEDILQSDSSLEIKPLQGALRINRKMVCGQDSTPLWSLCNRVCPGGCCSESCYDLASTVASEASCQVKNTRTHLHASSIKLKNTGPDKSPHI